MSERSVVVLLDQFTKDVTENITYDVISKHASVVMDIKEIGKELIGSSFVFFESAALTTVTPVALKELQESLDIQPYLVYMNNSTAKLYDDSVYKVKANYSKIDWNLVYAVVNKDSAILDAYRDVTEIIDLFKEVRAKLPPEITAVVERIYKSHINMASSVHRIIEDKTRTEELLAIQETSNKMQREAVIELKTLWDTAISKIKMYECLLSESYDIKFFGFYQNRPRVLYIKQISHLSGIDNLLTILFSVITKQYRASCKVVKLVDTTNAIDMRYVPNIYTGVPETYSTSDVLNNDFLIKLGAYNIMFDLLMLNRSGLDYLIVHDMRNTENISLDDALVDVRLNEMSSDHALLGEYDNILSDKGPSTTFCWSFGDISKFTGTNSVKLVNHPTVTQILDVFM